MVKNQYLDGETKYMSNFLDKFHTGDYVTKEDIQELTNELNDTFDRSRVITGVRDKLFRITKEKKLEIRIACVQVKPKSVKAIHPINVYSLRSSTEYVTFTDAIKAIYAGLASILDNYKEMENKANRYDAIMAITNK